MRSAILLLAYVLLNAPTEAASLGAHIRAGLGLPTTRQPNSEPTTSSIKATYTNATLTSSRYTNTTSTAVDASGSENTSAALACLTSWSAYNAFSATAETEVIVTITTYTVTTVDITYGTGDVYTTSAGIPVASGGFTTTTVEPTVLNVTTSSLDFTLSTQDPARLNATPTCLTIAPSQCSNLYVTYLSSLGLAPNASVPAITPAPTNSPPCPTYYYQPFSSCGPLSDADIASFGRCSISGANVQVFYFPPASLNATASYANATSQTVVQSYAPGITFTSPSVYLSFDYLSARSTSIIPESLCTFCDINGCATVTQGGEQGGVDDRGTTIAGALLTLAPEEVSTVIYNYTGAQATSMVDLLAHAPIGVESPFINDIVDAGLIYNLAPMLLDVNSITHPAPTDYYLNPGNVPGCDGDVVQPECHTIYEGLYRPIISLPSHAALLQGAWNTCVPIIFGAYDPPHALTAASTIAGVTRSPGFTTSGEQQTSSTYGGASPMQGLSTTVPGPTSTHAQSQPMSTSSPTIEAASAAQTASSEDVTTSGHYSSPLTSDAAPVQASEQGQSQGQNTNAQSQQSAGAPNMRSSTSREPLLPSNEDNPQPKPTTTNALSVLEGALTPSVEVQSEGAIDPATTSEASVRGGGQPTASDQLATSVLSSGGVIAVPTQVITAAGQTLTIASPSDVSDSAAAVVNGVGLQSGGPAATISGVVVSAGNGGVVVGGTTTVPSLPSSLSDPGSTVSGVVVTLGSQTITVAGNNGGIAVAGQTISQGNVVTTSVGGQAYTISKAGDGAILVNGVAASQTALMSEVDGQTDIAVEIGTSTIPLAHLNTNPSSGGGLVAYTTTVQSQTLTISEASNGAIVVDGVTASRTALVTGVASQITAVVEAGTQSSDSDPRTSIGAAITVGSTTLNVVPAVDQSGVEVVDGHVTLTIGGAPQVVAGVTLSATMSGVVEDGTFLPFSSITVTSKGTSPASAQSHSSTSAHIPPSSLPSAKASTSGAAYLGVVRSAGLWPLLIALMLATC